MQDEMKKDIGKTFVWKGKEITITNAFTCYEGDFYEYKIKGEDEVYRINIHADMSFVSAIRG